MTEPAKEVLRPIDAEAIRLAKILLRASRFGALAVLEPETGWPLASRVSVSTDTVGRPLILTSTLSAHTGALTADARCALLLGEPGKGDPLAHPRMTIKCRATHIARDAPERSKIARRFLSRHPKAALYADFADFSYFRLEPEEASLNGGFGKAYRLPRDTLLSDAAVAAELELTEDRVIAHMNADHRDALALYAKRFAGIDDVLDWRMTGIDPDGFDLLAGDRTARIFFDEPLPSVGHVRATLVAMAKGAREN